MSDRGFRVWFVFCAVMAVLVMGGAVTAIIVVFPHLLAMIDRIGK